MISLQDILALAGLARVKITKAEAVGLQNDFSTILDYVGQVNAVSSTVEASVPEHHNVMREDVPYAERDIVAMVGRRDVLVQAFPEEKDGFNVVRKIIQKDE
ncbi:MAG: hypothetical protein JWO43_149 [Candidatus Adlerbacteria bacterium]|nr:hypothetical protein [Candidatus Adlerbacteria bacterium]